MQKTIKVDGMMCAHCEAHVQKALLTIDGVTEAVADHEAKQVVVTLNREIADEVLFAAIRDQGYTVME